MMVFSIDIFKDIISARTNPRTSNSIAKEILKKDVFQKNSIIRAEMMRINKPFERPSFIR